MRNLTFRDILALPRAPVDSDYSDYITSAIRYGAIDSPLRGAYDDLYEDKIFKDITIGVLIDDYTNFRGTDIFVLTYLGKDACFVRSAGRGWEYSNSLVIDEDAYEAMVNYITSIMLAHQMGEGDPIEGLDLDSCATDFLNYYGSQWGLKEDSNILERLY